MGVFRQFPYSNFHEMNLDEMIKIIKNMLEEWAQYHAEWDAWMNQMNDDWSNYQEVMNEAWQNMQNFINNYFDNLNVQNEINNKITDMVNTGQFASIVEPYIPPRVTAWLTEHITEPVGVVIDTSLTVSGACADAKATGDVINDVKSDLDMLYPSALIKKLIVTRGGINTSTGVTNENLERVHTPLTLVRTGDVISVPNGYRYWLAQYNYISGTFTYVAKYPATGEYVGQHVIPFDGLVSIVLLKNNNVDFTADECYNTIDFNIKLYSTSENRTDDIYFEVGNINGTNDTYWYMLRGEDYYFWNDTNSVINATTRWKTAERILFHKGATISVASGYRYYLYIYNSDDSVSTSGWLTDTYTFSDDTIARIVVDTTADTKTAYNLWDSLDSIIFIWNNLEILELNSDINTKIGELSFETLGFRTIPLNLTLGQNLLYDSGTVVPGTDYETSDFVPVNPGEKYYISAVLGGAVADDNLNGIVGYNSSKQYVCGIVNQNDAGYDGARHLVELPFYIPLGVSYIRGCSAYRNTTDRPYPYKTLEIKQLNESTKTTSSLASEDELIALSEYNSYLSGDASSSLAYKKLFTLTAFSDIHGAKTQFQQTINLSNQHKNYLDAVTFLGDICGQNPNSDISFYVPSLSQLPLLPVVGNHDVADYGSISISQVEIFNRYVKPCVDANFIITNVPYYYKDFSDYNIRVITLMEYEGAVTSANATSDNYRRYITSEQLQWFADTLYSTPTDYSVIVLLHQIVHINPIIVECKFTENAIYRQVDNSFESGFGYQLNNMQGNPIGDIVQAFIEGTSINHSYTTTMISETRTSTVDKDFTDRGTGKFICYVSGHSHAPFVLKDGTYNNQIQILLPSASANYYQRKADDIRPTEESPNFYYLSFDTTNNFIKIVKEGNRTTMDMVERNIVSIPYN